MKEVRNIDIKNILIREKKGDTLTPEEIDTIRIISPETYDDINNELSLEIIAVKFYFDSPFDEEDEECFQVNKNFTIEDILQVQENLFVPEKTNLVKNIGGYILEDSMNKCLENVKTNSSNSHDENEVLMNQIKEQANKLRELTDNIAEQKNVFIKK